MDPERIGHSLRRLRTKRRLSVAAAAAGVGIDESYLWRLEAGRRLPSIRLLGRLAAFYRVSPGVLLGERDR